MAARRRRNAKGQFVKGGARRRRKARRNPVRINAPKRKRARRKATLTHLRSGKRRRANAAISHRNPPRRRRRYRRNPLGLPSGIANTVVQGFKDGLAVVGGQVVARKIRGAVTGMLPAGTAASLRAGPGYVALAVASAVAAAVAAKKFIPAQARMIAAGAFSEAINAALAQTPVAPYLGAYAPARRLVGRGNGAGRVAAYPTGGGVRPLAAYPTMRAVGT